MDHKMPTIVTVLIVTILMLAGSGSAAHGANAQALERVLDQWPLRGPPVMSRSFCNVEYKDVSFGAVNRGRNALRDFANDTFEAFPDLRFELKSRLVAADGKSGAMEWVWRGRQTKDLPGLPATNKAFAVRGASVVEFADGKISRNSDYWDLATYTKQVRLTN